MSITAYSGLPGSGKSYGVMENIIIPAVKAKRNIYTNIPVNNQKLEEQFGSTVNVFTFDDIKDNPQFFQEGVEPGSVVVIDECWRLWPSGMKATQALESHKSFLAEHRHMVGEDGKSTEIILVTQDLSQIASFARVLVETTYRAEKLSRVGQNKKFRIDVYHGPITGAHPPKNKRDSQMFGKYKPAIYELYSSHTMSKTGLAGDESKTDKRSNILYSSYFMMLPIVVIVFGLFIYYGFGQVKSGYTNPEQTENVQVKTASPSQQIVTNQVISEPVLDYVSGKHIAISWNNRKLKAVHYIFTVSDNNSKVYLEERHLEQLGYSLEPVNECLVIIKGQSSQYYASCENKKENSGFFGIGGSSSAI